MNPIRFFFIVCFFFSAINLLAEDYQVTASKLNIRNGPGTNYTVIGQLSRNEVVDVLNDDYGNWLEVNYNGKKGFVYSTHVVPIEYSGNTNFNVPALIWIPALVFAFLILIAFTAKKEALKNFGSVIILIACFIYTSLGLFGNLITMFLLGFNNPGAEMLSLFVSYGIILIVYILSIISFFKNLGLAILILSSIVLFIDLNAMGITGALSAGLAAFGAILNMVGFSQIKTEKENQEMYLNRYD